MTPGLRDRAALLAVDVAVLSGPSAARMHGLDVADRSTCLTVDPDRRVRLGAVQIRREPLPDGDITAIEGVVLTTRQRTVLDCLRWLPDRQAAELLDRALQKRWVEHDWLVTRVHGFAGRPGVDRLVMLTRQAADGARSAAERLLVTALRRARVPGWRANVEVYDDRGDLVGVVDVAFLELMLAVEVDGRAWHSAGDRFQRDRERQNRLVAAGWTVLRFTWLDLTRRPDEVVATIRAMLEQLRRRGR